MTKICNGTLEDFEQIRDFANYIFSQNRCPHDFKKLLPKIYDDNRNTAGYHYLVKEEGKIKAMVCALPMEFQVLDQKLKACGLGTVSVHPYSRGKGYMKFLMNTVIEEMKADGCAFAFLGGQRQRYEYFGFEPAGIQLSYTVTNINIRHFCKEGDTSPIEIVPFDGNEEEWLNRAYSLYQKQPLSVVRKRDEFISVLRSWESEPYVILKEGDLAGYFSLQANGTVNEIILDDLTLYPFLMRPLLNLCKTESFYLNAAPYETDKIHFFSQIAESCEVKTNCNYVIFNWAAVIRAFLNLKSKYEILEEGTLIIAVENTIIKITVSDGRVFVNETKEEADMVLSSLNAACFLFSPLGSFSPMESFSSLGSFMPGGYAKVSDKQKLLCLKTWFPLPLYTAAADGC